MVKCPNCGETAALPEGLDLGFCPSCGTRMGAEQHAEQASKTVAEPDYGAYTPTDYGVASHGVPEPQEFNKARRVNPKWFIVAAAAVVVIAAGAIFALPALGANAYQRAEIAFFQGLVTRAPLATDRGAEIKFDISYEPSGDIAYLGIPDIALSGGMSYAGQNAAANFSMEADGEVVPNIEAVFDGGEFKFSAPDVTRYYLRWALSGAYPADTVDFSQMDEKKLGASIAAVVKEYFMVTDEISEVEKGVQLSGGDVSVKCDRYTIDFTEDAVARIGLAAVKELRANDELKEFICGIALQQNSYYYDEYNDYDMDDMMRDFEEMLDEAEEELAALDGDGRLFCMTVWINDGKVIARKLDNIRGADGIELSYQYIHTENAVSIEAKLSFNDGSVSLKGDFEKSGGAWSGTPSFTVYDPYSGEIASFRVKCDAIRFSGKQHIAGKINISGMVYGETVCDLDITYGVDGDTQTAKLEGEIGGGNNTFDIGVLSLSYSSKSINSVNVSGSSDPYYGVVIDDYSDNNLNRAAQMSDELYALRDSKYSDNSLMQELLYACESILDNMIWEAGSYGDWYNNY
jgi:hypothetical protein